MKMKDFFAILKGDKFKANLMKLKIKYIESKTGYTRRRKIIFLSFPKSGRTWVRNFLNYYYFGLYPLALLDYVYCEYNVMNIPYVKFTHDGYTDFAIKKGKTIKSKREYLKNNVVFLVRDPRDVFVSYYYQLVSRNDVAKKEISNSIDWNNVSISQILRHEKFGIQAIVNFMINWNEFLDSMGENKCIYISYEKIKKDPKEEFRKILFFMGEDVINNYAFENAFEESKFEKMKNKEINNAHEQPELKAVNVNDGNSYKVRSGKTRGFLDVMSEQDLKYCDEVMIKLPNKILQIVENL